MRNNDEGIRGRNISRYSRLVKVFRWSDSNEFESSLTVMWNGNKDEKG